MMRCAASIVLAVLGSLTLSVGRAQDREDPDLAFLEYLGSWGESDEEWVVVAEWEPEATLPVDGRPEDEDVTSEEAQEEEEDNE